MSSNDNFKFHIIGAGRGGTSLLAGVIDAHPELCVMMEKHSIRYLMGRNEGGAEQGIEVPVRVSRRVDNFLNACEEEARKSSSLLCGHKTTTEQIGSLAHANPDYDIWDEREIDNSMKLFDVPEYFSKRVADSKIIFIIRDGRTCVRSKVARANRPIKNAITAWRYSIRMFNALRENCPQFHFLKFEDLLHDPANELEKVCDFLGVQFNSIMFEGTKSNKIKEEYRRPGFDTNAMLVGDGDLDITNEIREELSMLGYLK